MAQRAGESGGVWGEVLSLWLRPAFLHGLFADQVLEANKWEDFSTVLRLSKRLCTHSPGEMKGFGQQPRPLRPPYLLGWSSVGFKKPKWEMLAESSKSFFFNR